MKMKRLREMTFEDYSSSEEEQNDNEFEMIVDMNFNDDFLGSRRGSQIHNTAAYTSFFARRPHTHQPRESGGPCQDYERLFRPQSNLEVFCR